MHGFAGSRWISGWNTKAPVQLCSAAAVAGADHGISAAGP